MSRLSIACVGDISFAGKKADTPSIDAFSDVASLFEKIDIVIGNLEGPLINIGEGVPGKCVLRGSPGWAGILKQTGFDCVSLANNHIMDFGEEGLYETIDTLNKLGIRYAGAGRNIEAANNPIFMQAAGWRIAVLARSAVIVKSRCYAGQDAPGVAFLEIDETIESIGRCKKKADIILLILHWGIEEYFFPSPVQRKQARRLFEAGVDVIIGHHPHVVQGIEKIGKGMVAYSLGNFLFDDFEWRIESEDGSPKKIPIRMNRDNRSGMILQLHYNGGELESSSEIFTKIDADGYIAVDLSSERKKHTKQISKKLGIPFYAYFWKWHSIKREWQIRLSKQLRINNILKNFHKIRLHHIIALLQNLKKSAKITSGRSTNPYD